MFHCFVPLVFFIVTVVSWFVANMVIGGTYWYLLLVFVLVLLSLFFFTCLGCFLAAGAGCPLFRFMVSLPQLSGAALGGVSFFFGGCGLLPFV